MTLHFPCGKQAASRGTVRSTRLSCKRSKPLVMCSSLSWKPRIIESTVRSKTVIWFQSIQTHPMAMSGWYTEKWDTDVLLIHPLTLNTISVLVWCRCTCMHLSGYGSISKLAFNVNKSAKHEWKWCDVEIVLSDSLINKISYGCISWYRHQCICLPSLLLFILQETVFPAEWTSVPSCRILD